MILTGKKIEQLVQSGIITISPFNPEHCGPNSYDVCLGNWLVKIPAHTTFDVKHRKLLPDPVELTWDDSILIEPGNLYLMNTIEKVGSMDFVPLLEGRSSLARIGLSVHVTAGFGDLGFINQWTLEIFSMFPTRLYYGMRIAQVYFLEPSTERAKFYNGKYGKGEPVSTSKIFEDFK